MENRAANSVKVALALGSNLGDRLASLRAAVKALQVFINLDGTSAIYETPPAYVVDQPAYLNAAVIGTTLLSASELLQAVRKAEHDLGRQETFRYGPRVIDIDILFYGDLRVASSELTLPHPRLAEREFVVRPLADIAGDWRHPEIDRTIDDLLTIFSATTARRIQDALS